MSWEIIKENLSSFFNMPVVITITSVTLGFIYIMVIFSKTSLGKKLFSKALQKYDAVLDYCKEMKGNLETFKKEKEAQIAQIKEEYEKRLAVMANYVSQIEGALGKVAEATPNKKVKETINSFLEAKEERLEEIGKYLPNLEDYQALKAKAESVQEEIEKAKIEATEALQAKIALYDAKCEQLDNLLNKAEKTLEKANMTEGEVYEEGTDTDPEEETL